MVTGVPPMGDRGFSSHNCRLPQGRLLRVHSVKFGSRMHEAQKRWFSDMVENDLKSRKRFCLQAMALWWRKKRVMGTARLSKSVSLTLTIENMMSGNSSFTSLTQSYFAVVIPVKTEHVKTCTLFLREHRIVSAIQQRPRDRTSARNAWPSTALRAPGNLL